jgi:hypothetical protein
LRDDAEFALVRLRRFDHAGAIFRCGRHRFFDQHVFARSHGQDRLFGVLRVRRANHHGIYVGLLEHAVVIRPGSSLMRCGEGLRAFLVASTDRHQLSLGNVGERLSVRLRDLARTENRKPNHGVSTTFNA